MQPAEDTRREQPERRDRPPLVVLPYVSGASEDIRRVCGWYNLSVVFRSGRTLRSILTNVTDTLPLGKHSNVVYQIHCGGCNKVYIGETIRILETRLKEHQEALRRGMTEKSAVAEHTWDNQHSINWEEMSIIDQARRHKELVQWIGAYLTSRSQRTVVGGSASNWAPVLSGVPQGSILGPLLFIIYVNSIFELTLNS